MSNQVSSLYPPFVCPVTLPPLQPFLNTLVGSLHHLTSNPTPFLALVDVGRSCILVSLGGKNVMLDCGMHMGFNDQVQLPPQLIESRDFYIIQLSGRSHVLFS